MRDFKEFLKECADDGTLSQDDLKDIHKLSQELIEAHDKPKRDLAMYLSRIMEEDNLSFQELCERTGKSTRTLNGILKGTGNPTISTVAEIFRSLDREIQFQVQR